VLVARYDHADPAFPVSLVDVDRPVLPGPSWARVRVERAGICGSDLHLVYPNGPGSRVLNDFTTYPMEMGHEMAGTIVEAGEECPLPVGTRVAVDPGIACAARGLEPCARCAEGAASCCLRFASRAVTHGFGHGFTTGLGAGWAEELVAHPAQLHVVPDGVSIEAAGLTEPLSVSVHGVLRAPPPPGAPVLVVGAGMIGLTALAALRHLFPASEVTVLARHDHQAAAAVALGAHHVVRAAGGDEAVLHELAAVSGGFVTGRRDGAMLNGGYPLVVEAVGTGAAVTLAAKACGQRGAVLLVGATGPAEVNLAPVWFKELSVVGTFCHAVDRHGVGAPAHSFDRALALLAAGALPADVVVTHRFPLGELREACRVANDRASGALKVQLVP
jgi:threonine dehydrogenase-like Zn-dependent dehydrogenase